MLLDEIEADEDGRKAGNVIQLARQAASGGVVLRGGANHQGVEFTARRCFIFFAILIPPLLGQDRSRIAILELNPLAGREAPDLKPARLRELGAALRRRLLDRWGEFREILAGYKATLAGMGWSARDADQYGTLLAIADALLHDHGFNGDYAEAWCQKLGTAAAAFDDDLQADQEQCLRHLLSTTVDTYRGGQRYTLGELVQAAAGRLDTFSPPDADKLLQRHGLRVLYQGTEPAWLIVANQHRALLTLFEGSRWRGRAGATGPWIQALGRLPGAERAPRPIYFAGQVARGMRIPIGLLPGEEM